MTDYRKTISKPQISTNETKKNRDEPYIDAFTLVALETETAANRCDDVAKGMLFYKRCCDKEHVFT